MSNEITLAYEAGTRRAVLTFPNGKTLAIRDVTEEKAKEFLAKHGAEFQKRDCCLASVDGQFTREDANG